MKQLLIISFVLLFTATSGAQTPTPKPTNPLDELAKLEAITQPKPATGMGKPLSRTEWIYIGTTDDTPAKRIYYRDSRIRNGNGEAWVKFELIKPYRIRKFGKIKYYLQYATADCDGWRITMEATTIYNTAGKQIKTTPFTGLMGTFAEPILPNSIGYTIVDHLCQE